MRGTMVFQRAAEARLAALLISSVVVLTAAVAARATEPPQIPAGPTVRISDGWYHLEDCNIAVGRQAPSVTLAEALRRANGPCPICEPLRHKPEWAEFVAAHGEAIKTEVRARTEAEAAEAKRKKDAEEAERVKRLADLEAERKRREIAPVVRLTEAQARDIAQAAVAGAAGDLAQFQARYRALIREISPDYSGPQIVYGSAALRIVASGPLARFESAVADRMLKRQTPAGAVWAPDVAITVLPQTPESPDINQIVVQRSDALRPVGAETMVTVLSSTLAPRRLPGAPANARMVNAGEVVFPVSAFEPGEGVVVRVIAVPVSGANLSRTFTLMALRAIQ